MKNLVIMVACLAACGGDGLPVADSPTIGKCIGVLCAAPTDCQNPGACDPGTGTCVYAARPDGQDCNDGDACTLKDACKDGVCAGGEKQTCPAVDQCHSTGTCDPKTGCTNAELADGTACDDGNLCTQVDVCTSGACEGTPLSCASGDECKPTGVCNAGTGQCDYTAAPDDTECTLFAGTADETASSCKGGLCQSLCPTGHTDCNHDMRSDGCEVFTGGDPDNCGGCSVVCSATNVAIRGCAEGKCGGTCSAGYADCNGTASTTGCQTNLKTDFNHCGGCAVACRAAGTSNLQTSTCTNGGCAGTCKPGFANCNTDLVKDGCEINTKTDKLNCGACNRICPGTAVCSNGNCYRGSYTMGADAPAASTFLQDLSCRNGCAAKFGSPASGWQYLGSINPTVITFSCWADLHYYAGAFFTNEVKTCGQFGDQQALGTWGFWWSSKALSAWVNDPDPAYNACRNSPNFCYLTELP